jgi:hypothetical protein
MTPTHSNKNGARYRYYISHALLYLIRDRDCIYGTIVTRRLHAMGIRDMQKRNDKSASLMRVPVQEMVQRLNPGSVGGFQKFGNLYERPDWLAGAGTATDGG